MEPSRENPPPATSKPPERKPWPMSWVVYAILAFVVIQTVVNLEFRKKEKAHEPAAEMDERAKEQHFVNASMEGWSRLAATIEPVAKVTSAEGAAIQTKPTPTRFDAEVPFALAGKVERMPSLFPAPSHLEAPAKLTRENPFRLQLGFAKLERLPAFGDTWVYAKERELFIFLQDKSRLAPGSKPVPVAASQEIVIDARALEAGEWNAKLLTRDTIFTWSFSVQ